MENLIFLQAELNKIIEGLNCINLKQNVHSFEFNCSDLTDIAPYQNPALKTLITQLDHSLPTLYWFEIISEYPIEILKEDIYKCRKENKCKVPPTNRNSSKILYIGKARKKFQERVLQHLGYRSPNTWSLQLKHWKPDVILRLNYVQFIKGTNDIVLAFLEQSLADKLKPILGRHSL